MLVGSFVVDGISFVALDDSNVVLDNVVDALVVVMRNEVDVQDVVGRVEDVLYAVIMLVLKVDAKVLAVVDVTAELVVVIVLELTTVKVVVVVDDGVDVDVEVAVAEVTTGVVVAVLVVVATYTLQFLPLFVGE